MEIRLKGTIKTCYNEKFSNFFFLWKSSDWGAIFVNFYIFENAFIYHGMASCFAASKGVKKLGEVLVESLQLSFEEAVWKHSLTTRKGDENYDGSVYDMLYVWDLKSPMIFYQFCKTKQKSVEVCEDVLKLVEVKWCFSTTSNLEMKVSSHVTYGNYDSLQFIKYITKNVFPGVWVCFRFYFWKVRLKKPHSRTKQSSQLQKIS